VAVRERFHHGLLDASGGQLQSQFMPGRTTHALNDNAINQRPPTENRRISMLLPAGRSLPKTKPRLLGWTSLVDPV